MKHLLLSLLIFLASPAATFAQFLDDYGGVVPNVLAPAAGWRVAKYQNRWMFVTPSGNGMFLTGVYLVDTSGSTDDQGGNHDARVIVKYGSTDNWLYHQPKRLKSWGFNAIGEYSHARVIDAPLADRLPHNLIDRVSYYGLGNVDNYATGGSGASFKDLIDCLTGSSYTGYTGGLAPDVFDPKFTEYSDGRTQNLGTNAYYTSAWTIGLAIDDTDDLYGLAGPGDEVAGATQYHSHLGYIALVSSPTKTSSTKSFSVTYTVNTNYTKAELKTFMEGRYANIAALNTAWGSNYTTFGSSGGWPTGTGLMDEDGSNTSWLGATTGYLFDADADVKTDLDAFLYHYADKYFSVRASSVHTYLPGKLIFSPPSFNSWKGLVRHQILQAAGLYVDVVQAQAPTAEILTKTVQYVGDHPVVTGILVAGNADSGLYRYSPAFGVDDYATQPLRAAPYAALLAANFAQSESGTYPVAGFKFWALIDSWGEKGNYGLISTCDNAYDGVEAVNHSITDSWGYTTVAEERNYGNFLATVTTANLAVRASMQALSQFVIEPGATKATFRVGQIGLDYGADCSVVVKTSPGGTTVETITSTSGPSRRKLVTSVALTAATTYTAEQSCEGAATDAILHPFATLATPSGGNRTVPISLKPPAVLSTAARVTVDYGTTTSVADGSVQNTNCASGCTVNLTIPAGLMYYRWRWQTAADAVLATSAVQPLQVQ